MPSVASYLPVFRVLKLNSSVKRLINMDFGVYSTKELLQHGLSTWQIRRHAQTGLLTGLRLIRFPSHC